MLTLANFVLLAFPDDLDHDTMPEPIISTDAALTEPASRFSATGQSFAIREWRGSGPAKLHLHRLDDEAWHVLEGILRFRFLDRQLDAPAGTTVFVPAGVAHTYEAINARYLIVLPPRLVALIDALQQSSSGENEASIYRQYSSELLE